MSSKRLYFIIGGLILFFLFLFFLFYPRFSLEKERVLLGEAYTPNIKVSSLFFDLSKKLKIEENKVDTEKIGKHVIKCKVKYLFFDIKKTFIVTVFDDVKPTIELKGKEETYVCPNKEYEEEGYQATDNYDGDITDRVKVNKTKEEIIYSVKDSSSNEFKATRKLIYEDRENPTITLKGNKQMTLYLGNKYIEPGYTVSDNCDDLTDKVVIKSNLDVNRVGNYTIEYSVTDSSGNTVVVKRKITVKKIVKTSGNGNIYLTFDDGPSQLTKEILDILEEEGIKATFFVISANDYTKMAYTSGHSIGLHSNTHDYKYIYTSSDNYFKDLNLIQEKVYKVIGYKSYLLRFPGGSSNTVSRKYKKGMMSYLTKEVLQKGYTYYDWNVDSNDAGGDTNNSQKIYNNVVNGLSHSKTNIVLMHDSANHKATVKALRDIIHYGKNNGYSFLPITKDTPVVRHGVNN